MCSPWDIETETPLQRRCVVTFQANRVDGGRVFSAHTLLHTSAVREAHPLLPLRSTPHLPGLLMTT
jgi:hypothetical protein